MNIIQGTYSRVVRPTNLGFSAAKRQLKISS